jgi:hypothetical protein
VTLVWLENPNLCWEAILTHWQNVEIPVDAFNTEMSRNFVPTSGMVVSGTLDYMPGIIRDFGIGISTAEIHSL